MWVRNFSIGSMKTRSKPDCKSRSAPIPERRRFQPSQGKRYLAFFKPYEVLCQFSQPADSDKRTLSEFGLPANVYPVGRLDYDSEGLLILSDDGSLNQALLQPELGHERVYLAQVENLPLDNQLAQLESGVLIEGARTRPARATLLPGDPALPSRSVPIRERKNIPTAWIRLVLSEGRNRQVRKMTAAVGCPTLRLVRIAIGLVNLFDLALQPGEWLQLSNEQVAQLFEKADDKFVLPCRHS